MKTVFLHNLIHNALSQRYMTLRRVEPLSPCLTYRSRTRQSNAISTNSAFAYKWSVTSTKHEGTKILKTSVWTDTVVKLYSRESRINRDYIVLDTFRSRIMDHTVFHKWLIKQTKFNKPTLELWKSACWSGARNIYHGTVMTWQKKDKCYSMTQSYGWTA